VVEEDEGRKDTEAEGCVGGEDAVAVAGMGGRGRE